MKIYKNKLFLLSSALSMVLFQACTDADNPIDQVYEGTQRGAVLRTIAVVSNELPIGQSTAGFAVDLEIQDVENGDLVETVNVYVRFTDNTIEDGGTDFSKPEVAAGTIPRADFTPGPRGLPQTSYSIGLQAMQTLLGVADDQVDGGDVFRVRFELVLVDGRTFSLANNTATLTQSFFASPFVYNATVVCPVEATVFVGNYLIEQITPEVDGPTLSTGTIVALAVGESSTQRVFQTANYPLYCSGLTPFTIELVCGRVTIPNQSSSCSCVSGGDWFTNPVVFSTYDNGDDSVFEVTFTDDAQSDCSSPAQTTYRFTKQ